MSRSCTTCQHLKRPEIDRHLAADEPSAQIARDYELTASSLHRQRVNCLKLGSSNAIMKDAARRSAAVVLSELNSIRHLGQPGPTGGHTAGAQVNVSVQNNVNVNVTHMVLAARFDIGP